MLTGTFTGDRIKRLLEKDDLFSYQGNEWIGVTVANFCALAGQVQFIKTNYPESDLYGKYVELFVQGADLPMAIIAKPEPATPATGCGSCGGGKVL